MNEKTMYFHAVQKWQWIVDKWDYSKSVNYNYDLLREDLPYLVKYPALCAFCDAYTSLCASCPLYELYGNQCYDDITSPYKKWASYIVNNINGYNEAFDMLVDVTTVAKIAGYVFTLDELRKS